MSVTTTSDLTADQAARASYATVAAELHAIADAIDAMPVEGLAQLRVALEFSTKLFAKDPDACAIKVATVDAVGLAVLGKAGKASQVGSTDSWTHQAKGARGPVQLDIYDFVADPTAREREAAEQARQDEVERLRAEVAELRAAASSVADYALTDRAADVILDLADMHRTGLIRDARTLDDAATAEAAQEADTDRRERAFEDAYAARDETA